MWDNPRFFAAGPTRDQTKKIFWADLKRLVPKGWIEKISESELSISTRWGAELHVVGLDRPERMEGSPWDGGCVTEFANCRPGIFQEHILPAMSDRHGWLWLEGVPDYVGQCQSEYEKLCERGRYGNDPEWADFAWNSSEVLAAAEIESMSHGMDRRIFLQETGGQFVRPGNLACPDFDQVVHVDAAIARYDPALPICWSLDFNIAKNSPACSGILQDYNGQVRIIAELVLEQVKTETVCDVFLDLVKQRNWNLQNMRVYGDPTGNARDSTSGITDWHILRNRLKNYDAQFRYRASPVGIKDTLNALNAKLKNAAGEVGLHIHPDCVRIIDDIKFAPWPSDLEAQHALAWLRYFAEREYPVRIQYEHKPQRVFSV